MRKDKLILNLPKVFPQILLFVGFFFVGIQMQAQNRTISGKVTSAQGDPLEGVTVTVKNTPQATTTDKSGSYSIVTNTANPILVFSYVNYESKEVTLNNRSAVSVSLAAKAGVLGEVVVVGYGTQKKSDVTGAIGTIKTDDIDRRVVSNFQQSLQGLTSGLTVLDEGGAPGQSTATLRIRGITTLSGNDPLILVDGVEQGINNLNPEDIASVSVLKDAAATAIYGSRAAAGVILITTKRAKAGKLMIRLDNYVALQKLGNHPESMGTADFLRQQNTAYQNAGLGTPYSDSLIQVWSTSKDRIKYPLPNDWYNVLFHTAPQYNSNLSLSGGNEQIRTSMNLRYMHQDGIVNNFSNEAKEIRLNTDFTPTKNLKFSADGFYRMLYSTQPQDAGGLFGTMIQGAQLTVPRYPDGGYGVSTQGNNPLVSDELSGYDRNRFNYFSGNLRGEWQIINGLKLSVQYAIVNTTSRGKNYRNAYSVTDENNPSLSKSVTNNQLIESNSNNYTETINDLLEYTRQIGKHDIKILGGYSQIYSRGDNFSASRTNFYNNSIQAVSQGDPNTRDNGGSDNESGLRSYFGRINYNYDDKYLLEVNGRYDGSAKFTGNNLYSFFPSFSAGWRISQEGFWQSVKHIIPALKIRGSWGETGNQTVASYSFYDALNSSNYDFGGIAAVGYALHNYSNGDIKWETTTQTDIGLDAGILKNKINFTFDYYNKKTTGILLQLPIPAIVGRNAPVQNAGTVSNKGWEVSVDYNGNSSNLSYQFGFNLSNNKNEVLDLKGTGPYISGSDNDALNIIEVGLPINSLWGFKTDGFYKDQKDVDTSAAYDPKTFPGDIKYIDLNNDGKITADDRTVIGDPFPHYSYGFKSSIQYKNFDFYLFLQGVVKQDADISGPVVNAGANEGFVPQIANDYWTPTHTNSLYPRPQKKSGKNARISDYWILQVGYLRIKTLQVGYSLPQSIIEKLKIEKARIYLSAMNLLTISKQAKKWGIDPEFPSGSRLLYYPQTKSYTIGLNITF